MWRTTFIAAGFLTAATLAAMLGMNQRPGQDENPSHPIRIGIYDNRAVAIAYAASEFNPVSSKVKELEIAKTEGDAEKIAELETWGRTHQRHLHRQGFGRVPVGDLLEPVKHRLPALAQELGVDAIVFDCNFAAPGVETVDVTLDLVTLYQPSERTMKWIAESLKTDPIDLDTIEQSHNH